MEINDDNGIYKQFGLEFMFQYCMDVCWHGLVNDALNNSLRQKEAEGM